MASKTTFKYYVYSETPVVSYIKGGRMGVFAVNAFTRKFERDGILIGLIDFDRNGLAREVNRNQFLKLVREKGVLEFPEDIAELRVSERATPTARGVKPGKPEPVVALSRKTAAGQVKVAR